MKHTCSAVADGLKRPLVIATSIAVLLVPLTGHADTCKRNADEKSVFMRSLQTDLMVAALTCNQSDQYNTFIHRFQPVLMRDARQLQSYYSRAGGKGGAEELNAFVTQLANDESERSIQTGQASYCDSAGKMFDAVLALSPEQLEDYAAQQRIVASAPVHPCPVQAQAAPTMTGDVAILKTGGDQ